MSTKPRTIDNLGVDISRRYARDKESVDSRFIEESKFIQSGAEISVTSPYIPSDFEELFDISNKNSTWAKFFSPPDVNPQKKRLFSYQIIPAIGTLELRRVKMEKIKNKRKKKKNPSLKDKEEEKEESSLVRLLEVLSFLDKQLEFINQRRNQYHKG